MRSIPSIGAGNFFAVCREFFSTGREFCCTASRKPSASGNAVHKSNYDNIWWRRRNAATPIVTVLALEIANLLAGAIIVETVFAWPGLGQLAVQSIAARDFPIVQGIVLLGAVVSIGLNLLADLLYSVVDPRVRLTGAA